MLGEIETKAAPAAADVECALTLSHQQLCGQVPLLGELSVVKRLFRRFEIGAAILPVGVQEQRVKPAVQIVVMRDIASRARAMVVLVDAPSAVAQHGTRPRKEWKPVTARLREQEGEQIGYRAAFQHEVAVHIGFAEAQFGMQHHARHRRA